MATPSELFCWQVRYLFYVYESPTLLFPAALSARRRHACGRFICVHHRPILQPVTRYCQRARRHDAPVCHILYPAGHYISAVSAAPLAYIHTQPFNGPVSTTTRVSRYQKGKTNLDFTEARDSEWQWHQLGHTQVCTSLQTDNHASTPPLSFFTGRMPFLPPNQQRQSTEGNTISLYIAANPIIRSVAVNARKSRSSRRTARSVVARSPRTRHPPRRGEISRSVASAMMWPQVWASCWHCTRLCHRAFSTGRGVAR